MDLIKNSISRPFVKAKKPHSCLHIDLTPMVDMAMLLITFFMLTAVFNRPQVMELNLPKGEIPVRESKVFNIWVDRNSILYKSCGTSDPIQRINPVDLHNELTVFKEKVPDMIARIKIDRRAQYQKLVDILDEIGLTSIQRFGLVPVSKEEQIHLNELASK